MQTEGYMNIFRYAQSVLPKDCTIFYFSSNMRMFISIASSTVCQTRLGLGSKWLNTTKVNF